MSNIGDKKTPSDKGLVKPDATRPGGSAIPGRPIPERSDNTTSPDAKGPASSRIPDSRFSARTSSTADRSSTTPDKTKRDMPTRGKEQPSTTDLPETSTPSKSQEVKASDQTSQTSPPEKEIKEVEPPENPPKPPDKPPLEKERKGLVVRFEDKQFRTIHLEDLPDSPQNVDQKVASLFQQLGLQLPVEAVQDTSRTDTQKYLDHIIASADKDSINYDTFRETFDALRQGQLPDTKNWQQLEFFRNAVEPIFDERTKFPKGVTRDTYFSHYFQNLKDKGVDYEQLIKTYVQANDSMNVAEAHAIFGYTTISIYPELNRMMREHRNPERTAEFTELLESALARMPSDDRTQYRGINIPAKQLPQFLQEYQRGATVEPGQFLSSARYQIEPFWSDGNVHIEIAPTNAHNITDLAFGTHFIQTLTPKRSNDSDEVLFSHDAQFRVEDVSRENGVDPKTGKSRDIYYIKLQQTQ